MSGQGGPKKIGDLLAAVLARRGYGNATAQLELERTWKLVAGDRIAKQTRVGSFRRGVLEVLVDSAPLLAELDGFRKEELLQALADRVEHSTISSLRFRRR
jgi:predicted nucleic acid-binding Zn ribbon protein